MKVAIYARYSSENQREASIEDQFRICREFATRQGWTVTQEFTDHAISGATLLRSGFQALMRDESIDGIRLIDMPDLRGELFTLTVCHQCHPKVRRILQATENQRASAAPGVQ